MGLKDQVAVVTGGSRGIGAACCLALAREGVKVVVNSCPQADNQLNKANAVDEVIARIESENGIAMAHAADIADEQQARGLIRSAVEQFGGLDILVNNAGICPMLEFDKITMDVFDRVHAVNLRGAFVCSQEAARIMIKQGRGGRIIAISSISARVGGPEQVHYCPTKSGLHSLMQSLAICLGPHGITCNSIGPGEVNTDMNRVIPRCEEYWADLIPRLPLRRIAQPNDIADSVVFFASDKAQYLTGQLLMVDGGMLTGLLV